MAKSFAHFTPFHDPDGAYNPPGYCDLDSCLAYTEAEHLALMKASEPLTAALFAALDAYSAQHPEITYDLILHALDGLAYCLTKQMEADDADTES